MVENIAVIEVGPYIEAAKERMKFINANKGEQIPWPQASTEIQDLLDLCLNNLDAFSVLLFIREKESGRLHIKAIQSLSKNINFRSAIFPGIGAIGKAYLNKQTVNLDQDTIQSEKLLFYSSDENIKSLMAAPLPGIDGLLLVDSKQRYIFTDKSAKLLFQFGQSIEKAWQRLTGGNKKEKKHKTIACCKQESAEQELLRHLAELWLNLEDKLARPDHDGGGLEAALETLCQYTGLSWGFITALLPADNKNYHVVAKHGLVPDEMPTKNQLNSGLAGWIHTRGQALHLDKLKTDGQHSYIFRKDETLKGMRSFYGWPLIYNNQLRGCFMLAGKEGESLDAMKNQAMECVVKRLATQLHHDRLLVRIMDLNRLDPQTGLPHRGYFIERLSHLMEMADLNSSGIVLFVLATNGIGAFSCENGQYAANDLLKSIARQLVEVSRPGWEIAHISYGLFAMAVPLKDEDEAVNAIKRFKKKLEDWPLTEQSGRVDLGLYPAAAAYPRDGSKPEELLELALTALAGGDDEDERTVKNGEEKIQEKPSGDE